LDSQSQALVKQAAFDFQMNPANPGAQFHRIDRSRDKNFWSFRVNRDLRIIVHRTSESLMLCYADHHDPAYIWAERRKMEVHPETGAAQIVEVVERTEEIIQRVVHQVSEMPRLFDRYEGDYLAALGVPPEWLEAVRHVTEDNFDQLFEHLPEEAIERLMELACGNPVPVPIRVSGVSPFTHPDAKRRFRFLEDQQELQQALDYPWEKWIVFLHPFQRSIVERSLSGPGRVTGPAGTGKSVVGLHRAAHLAKGSAAASVLLTTFSKTLARRLSSSADLLLGSDSAARGCIEVVHLHRKALELWHSPGRRFRPANNRQLAAAFENATAAVGSKKFTAAFVQAEWDAIIDPWGIDDWEIYRNFSRAGRGTPLGARQRLRLWKVVERAREFLASRGLMTWNQLCHEVANQLEESGDRPYRHVVADEAQDFGPGELRFVRALAPAADNDLFFCGDAGQRIYKSRFSWLSAGIDVRGRSSRLKINYRTTEQIRRFADGLLPGFVQEPDGDYQSRVGASLLNGPTPEVRGFEAVVDEVEGIAQQVEVFVRDGIAPGDLAIFARTGSLLKERAEDALELCGLPWSYLDDDAEPERDRVALGSMHRAKGLEFKAVIVLGCDMDALPLSFVLRSLPDDADGAAFVEQERQLLYVACTRARDRLLVTYTGKPSEFIRPDTDGNRQVVHASQAQGR
jgi:hypothetical protein